MMLDTLDMARAGAKTIRPVYNDTGTVLGAVTSDQDGRFTAYVWMDASEQRTEPYPHTRVNGFVTIGRANTLRTATKYVKTA